ncbi:sn-glycerol 3-phosphate transport system ATP-binding protein [Peteryoungia aggregata LMG 23059]|uniref:Sn-glycerol 3-phosphate transport system ATP-binding protein n=1 Tax=Peteryoungia aggregata LMG 23059 TaxID=1368425 RepID=A0ABU0G464_9HYPH|nr:sn-glycerol-3-phosphate import ATP-binding protein UgpC [Peteryoungia aggregata]MDQ0420120.1 sn-glycerol 3-phosphate transport system ATP-binding protein [Peteryoungia aggregata LMG 23059]
MASIGIKQVSKIYDKGGAKAVDTVDIQIEDGEFIVLVGPSGCGKSTLLRMVAGLEDISQGTISIGDRVVNQIEPADRDIAMVFQNYALYPHMTVYDNLAYGLKNRGTPKTEIAARVAEAARMLEIEKYLDRKPRALSGGQRQRVAMGRAIVRKPAVFLFDEPLSNLDAKLRVSMRGEIRKLQKRLKTTAIYVTHDQLEAMTLADRLVVLNGGVIEQIGTPLEVYNRPASTFVASFIGSPAMNLVDGHIDGGQLTIGDARLSLYEAWPDGAVRVGMRAEDLVLAGDGPADFHLVVDYVEELGAQRLVHGLIGGQALTAVLGSQVELADRLPLRIEADRLHFFTSDTGRRMFPSRPSVASEPATRDALPLPALA